VELTLKRRVGLSRSLPEAQLFRGEIMHNKILAAMFIAAGLMASTNGAWADRETIETRAYQPTAQTTTTTTTSQPDSAVVVQDSKGNTAVIETPSASTTVEKTTTTQVQPVVVEETTYIKKRHHHHHFINLKAPFIHSEVD
jgi:hypothetical protein